MRKLVFGLVAATVALPTVAAAQPGYYGSGRANYAHPADRNGDGVVTRREAERYQRRLERQYERQAERAYGSSNGYYGNSYGSNQGYHGNSYGSSQGYYGNSYGSNQGYYGNGQSSAYGNNYSQYYDRSGYYSGPTWRGDDGRYYCRRSDGTLGTIIGGAIGAVIGNSVERGGNRQRCN